jgi:hypothetical protein
MAHLKNHINTNSECLHVLGAIYEITNFKLFHLLVSLHITNWIIQRQHTEQAHSLPFICWLRKSKDSRELSKFAPYIHSFSKKLYLKTCLPVLSPASSSFRVKIYNALADMELILIDLPVHINCLLVYILVCTGLKKKRKLWLLLL